MRSGAILAPRRATAEADDLSTLQELTLPHNRNIKEMGVDVLGAVIPNDPHVPSVRTAPPRGFNSPVLGGKHRGSCVGIPIGAVNPVEVHTVVVDSAVKAAAGSVVVPSERRCPRRG